MGNETLVPVSQTDDADVDVVLIDADGEPCDDRETPSGEDTTPIFAIRPVTTFPAIPGSDQTNTARVMTVDVTSVDDKSLDYIRETCSFNYHPPIEINRLTMLENRGEYFQLDITPLVGKHVSCLEPMPRVLRRLVVTAAAYGFSVIRIVDTDDRSRPTPFPWMGYYPFSRIDELPF